MPNSNRRKKTMVRSAFLSLVRSGLWNVPADPAPFRSMNATDWEEIYRFARTQALLAITFDGMASLPPEIRPPRPLYLQWATLIVRIEQANKHLNSALPFSIKGIEHEGEVLLDDIFAIGNFGWYDTRISPRPKGYWTGKWHTFRKATKRCMKLRHFAPGEAVWYPVTLIKRTIAIRFNRTLSTFKYPHKKTNPKHSSPYNN